MANPEDLLEEIGQKCLETVGEKYDRFVMYAIFDDHTMANALFCQDKTTKNIYCVRFPSELSDLIFSLREEMEKRKSAWIFMEYSVIGDELNVVYKYADSFTNGVLDELEIRKEILLRFFQSTKVIYPKPGFYGIKSTNPTIK